MATVDKEFADLLIKHNGWTDENDHDAPDNPQCVRITKYQDIGGKDAYGAVFANDRDIGRYRESEFVRNPVLYWEPKKSAQTVETSRFTSPPRAVEPSFSSPAAWPFPTASAPVESTPEREPAFSSGGGGNFGGGGASSSWSDSSSSSSSSSSSDSSSSSSSDSGSCSSSSSD